MKFYSSLVMLFVVGVLFVQCKPSADKNKPNVPALTAWNHQAQVNPDTEADINTITEYVNAVCTPGSSDFIPVADRIAVFDLDGTCACERPISMQLYCGAELAKMNDSACFTDEHALQNRVNASFHGGYLPNNISSDSLIEFSRIYSKLLINKCIPVNQPEEKPLSKLFYLPMMQIMDYLLYHEFSVYLVSGSSQQFLLGAAKNVEPLSKLPASHIIGSLQKYQKLVHTPGAYPDFYLDTVNFLSNVTQGKAINIYNRIGQKPVLAFGNTTGDLDMFSFTSSNTRYKTLCVLINHDSGDMEDCYEPFKDELVTKSWNQESYGNQKWTQELFFNLLKEQGWKTANMSKVFLPDSVFVQ